jgi:hypothetical protein
MIANKMKPKSLTDLNQQMRKLRKLRTAVALLSTIGTSVFAQPFDPDVGTGKIAPIVSNESAYAQDRSATESRSDVVAKRRKISKRGSPIRQDRLYDKQDRPYDGCTIGLSPASLSSGNCNSM